MPTVPMLSAPFNPLLFNFFVVYKSISSLRATLFSSSCTIFEYVNIYYFNLGKTDLYLLLHPPPWNDQLLW